MKLLLIITLFTISISAVEWGLLQAVSEKQVYKEERLVRVMIPSTGITNVREVNEALFRQHSMHKGSLLYSKNRKLTGGQHFDGRTAW